MFDKCEFKQISLRDQWSVYLSIDGSSWNSCFVTWQRCIATKISDQALLLGNKSFKSCQHTCSGVIHRSGPSFCQSLPTVWEAAVEQNQYGPDAGAPRVPTLPLFLCFYSDKHNLTMSPVWKDDIWCLFTVLSIIIKKKKLDLVHIIINDRSGISKRIYWNLRWICRSSSFWRVILLDFFFVPCREYLGRQLQSTDQQQAPAVAARSWSLPGAPPSVCGWACAVWTLFFFFFFCHV